MCEEFEWSAWRHEAEQPAEREDNDNMKKQEKAAMLAKPVKPEQQQEEPVPA
jgi:hypothetical protein